MNEVDKTKAKDDYKTGNYTFKQLAEKYRIKESTIKSWAKRDKDAGQPWEKVATKKKKVATKPKVLEKVEIENPELTEKQKLFCLYYVKSFNATVSMIKAGYAKESAHVEGSRLLRNPKIRNEIRRIKSLMVEEVFVEAIDVLKKYVAIAFADITDYLTFGKKEATIGKDEDGDPIIATVNYVDFKESSEVDGTVISEVKKGKDGVSIKMVDKTWALEKLERYFDLLPDNFKRQLEEEKLKLAKEKLEMEKGKENQEDKPIKISIVRKVKENG